MLILVHIHFMLTHFSIVKYAVATASSDFCFTPLYNCIKSCLNNALGIVKSANVVECCFHIVPSVFIFLFWIHVFCSSFA